MSAKERRRLAALERVKSGEWTLTMASRSLGLSYRQTKRAWARFRVEGDNGLTHRSRGRVSSRRIAEAIRDRAMQAIREKYADFGPTLMSEHLAGSEKIVVSVSTLRRWLHAEGMLQRRRRGPKHRTRRERKHHFGELVQLDGSRHDWFEGRRDWACLMVMIDDATSRMVARFHEVESTAAAMDVFAAWVAKYGVPAEVYPDRHSIYRTDREPTDAEALSDVTPMTQFGRAMDSLGVRLRLAGSPQAKGRVERMNGTLQDRLAKELRLRKISTLEAANRLLASKWFEQLSERFSKAPHQQADMHQPAPSKRELRKVLSIWEPRTVGQDAVVQWEKRWFQLKRTKGLVKLAGREATVISRQDEVLAIQVGDIEVRFREVPAPAKPKPYSKGPIGVGPTPKPARTHPWRKRVTTPR